MKISQVIKAARKKAGIKQLLLGQQCGWGEDSQSRVSNYETGLREPSIADLIRIAQVCKVSAAEMVADVEGVDLRAKFGALLSDGDQQFVVSKAAAMIARAYDDSDDANKDIIDRMLGIRSSVQQAGTRINEPPKNEKARRSNRRTVQSP